LTSASVVAGPGPGARYAWKRDVPRTASVGKRLAAFALDAVVVFALAWTATFVLAALGWLRIPSVELLGGQNAAAGLMWLVSILEIPVLLVYFTLFEARLGRTPGKMLLGLRVARAEDGGRVDMGHCFLRNLIRLLWATPLAPVVVAMLALDVWSLGASELDQRLGDMAAGTIVIDERLVV
jgi:uncharacterized RDD family membrane protein YckC